MDLVEKLTKLNNLSREELISLLETDIYDEALAHQADTVRRSIYGEDVYLRGLIEFTNYCKNNCYYCGIRRDNKNASRYRMSPEEILSTCKYGYEQGFKTFVLQGGEDPYYTDEIMCRIISEIRKNFPDCAITLSIGEKSKDSYKAYFEAGANRYLLRHETATDDHYRKLHPEEMSLSYRKECLYNLKEIGFQVGAGFMVGSPYQTLDNLAEDLLFLKELQPDMVGIGPFISHKDTPFADENNGTLEMTLRLISIVRLLLPNSLIPATTALGTIHPQGRELGLKAGANVMMPNISPKEAKDKYMLYNNKICVNEDYEKCAGCLEQRVKSAGYKIVDSIGNPIKAL